MNNVSTGYFLICSGVGAVMGTGSALAMRVAIPELMFSGLFMIGLGVCWLALNGEFKLRK